MVVREQAASGSPAEDTAQTKDIHPEMGCWAESLNLTLNFKEEHLDFCYSMTSDAS
jgi:hypothetical protein